MMMGASDEDEHSRESKGSDKEARKDTRQATREATLFSERDENNKNEHYEIMSEEIKNE